MKNVSKLIETSKGTWKQAKFQGVEYMPLQMDFPERVGSMIVKMAPGSTYPKHRHTQHEELFVLKGALTVGDQALKSGDYFYSPQGVIHQKATTEGCIFLMIIPGGIEIISASNYEDMEPVSEEAPFTVTE